ncbi:MAG: DUF1682 domain-containing protein [Bacteroidales bacterium]|jgi:Spy/CpxP family protein refolding chaperone|nr:DUF1682 domain-containing protein [Bacteroidales bacterium]
MKRVFLFSVLFLGIISFAQAQQPQRGSGERPGGQRQGGPGGDPAQRIERQVQELKDTLKLSADQVTKIKAILTKADEKRREEMQKARESGQQQQIDREAMRKQFEEARAKQTEEIKAVLTKDQKTEYDAYQKRAEARMRERFQNGGGRQGGERQGGERPANNSTTR